MFQSKRNSQAVNQVKYWVKIFLDPYQIKLLIVWLPSSIVQFFIDNSLTCQLCFALIVAYHTGSVTVVDEIVLNWMFNILIPLVFAILIQLSWQLIYYFGLSWICNKLCRIQYAAYNIHMLHTYTYAAYNILLLYEY